MLRALRRSIRTRATGAAAWVAPHLSRRAVDRVRTLLACCGPHLPVIGRIVADNMRCLGLYSRDVHRAYFAQVGEHLAGALHALRCADEARDHGPSPELARIAGERVELDESVAKLHAAAAGGRGVVIMGPHIAGYLIHLARLNGEIPLTVFLRHSRDERKRAAQQRWYRSSGVSWISESAAAGGALGRLGSMSKAVAGGGALYITPDLPRKRGDGLPVRFFGREIYLPAGPGMLAVRTGAPLLMLLARPSGAGVRLYVRGPFEAPPRARGRAARQAAIGQRLQWFATCFEEFLTAHPQLWYLWGDKRWTRVLRGDPSYAGRLKCGGSDAGGTVEGGT